MKKILSIILLSALLLFSTACGNTSQPVSMEANSNSVLEIPSENETTPTEENPSQEDTSLVSDELYDAEQSNGAPQNAQGIVNQANTLTEHLAFSLKQPIGEEKTDFEDLEINNFVFLTFRFMNNKDYYYSNLIAEGEMYEINANHLNQVIYEVFGINTWDLQGGDTEQNTEENQYETSLGFDFGGDYQATDIQSTVNGNEIVSIFMLTGVQAGKSTPEEIGKYQIIYDIESEGGAEFLRFVKLEKVSY